MSAARKPVDGENEVVTITAMKPQRAPGGSIFWHAEGKLDGVLMVLQVWPEDRRMFRQAGHGDIFHSFRDVKVSIEVVTRLDERNRWRVAEVYDAEGNVFKPTLLSGQQRIEDWTYDTLTYGKPLEAGNSAVFVKLGLPGVLWQKQPDGTYKRTASRDDVRLYEAKVETENTVK